MSEDLQQDAEQAEIAVPGAESRRDPEPVYGDFCPFCGLPWYTCNHSTGVEPVRRQVS